MITCSTQLCTGKKPTRPADFIFNDNSLLVYLSILHSDRKYNSLCKRGRFLQMSVNI